MKRPFACMGLSMLFSIVFAVIFRAVSLYVAIACFVLSGIFAAIYFIGKKMTLSHAVCCLFACIAIFSYLNVIEKHVEPLIEEYDGQTVEFSATVTSKPYTTGKNTYFTVKTDTINGIEKSINIQITTSYALSVDIYDTIKGTAELYSNFESGYGYASYYGARDIFLMAYINPYYDSSYEVIHNADRPFYAVFSDIRDIISTTFKKYLAYDEASLCTAVITGEKNYLRDRIYGNFKNLGVSHILVVSGLHLSIVSALLYSISNRTIKNRYLSAFIQILGAVAFAALSGFGFSVIRALVMSVVMILARMFSSKADALNSLGLAALILCINPLNAGDIGMLWSFSCTLSLILFSKPVFNYLNDKLKIFEWIPGKVIYLVSTAMAAFVGSLPFLIFVTGSLSPYTIIANVLTVPFTGIIIVCGGLSVLFFSLHMSIIAYPLVYMSGITAKYLIFVTDIFSKMPMATVRTSKSYVYVWLLISAVVFAFFYFTNKKRYVKLSVLTILAAFIALYSLDTIFNFEKITLSVLDIGNGLTVTAKCGDDIVLINSYGEKYQYSVIQDELSEYNSIDCMIDIPCEKTEYDYCRKIINEFDVSNVLLNDSEMYEYDYCYPKSKGVNVALIEENYSLYLFDNALLNIIKTGETTWQYLNIYDTDILICPPQSDFSNLPDEFKDPSIVVINDIPSNFNISEDTLVIVSNYSNDCDNIVNDLNNKGFTPIATNGLGRIDIQIDDNDSISLKREYTGGVTRYDDDTDEEQLQ